MINFIIIIIKLFLFTILIDIIQTNIFLAFLRIRNILLTINKIIFFFNFIQLSLYPIFILYNFIILFH
jgi:hypothetical protein